MKKIMLLSTFCLAIIACEQSVPQLGKASVDEVLKAMTVDEKVTLLIGSGMAGFSGDSAVVGETKQLVPGAAGTTYPIPRLGIPAIVLADGPAGLRISPVRKDDSQTYYCTAFPVATSLASTWNTELVEEVGKAMGNEVLEYGADVLLAPALNIHRNPLCGRNFEYYSEDPLLSGKIAAAMTKGVQSNGVGVSLKHFAVNNQETNRMADDARVSQRALREIYLKGFEIAVKEANPWTVMSSYNKVNGTYASESRELLTNILRNDWGFDGTVMTDWFGGRNPAAQVHAGNDLLMPGTIKQKEAILAALKDGTLNEADVDVNVKRILNLILMSPRFKGYKYSNHPDLKAHAAVTRQSAAEGMVLLKNNNKTLPLASTVKNVAVFGVTSYDFIAGGTGSGDVNEAYTVSLVEGLTNAGYTLDANMQAQYEKYIKDEHEKNKPQGQMAAFMPRVRPVEWIPDATRLSALAKSTDVALITIGRTSGEFADRKLEGDFELTEIEKQLIDRVAKSFRAQGKKTIVILNIGGVIETASWKNVPDAILLAWQPGQEGGNTVADVLAGKVNPSGKLTMTFPVNYMDAASSANFPYDYKPARGFGMMSGQAEKKPEDMVKNVDYTDYAEGIFVGYRWFDTQKKEVSYPFGYGLSYTTFELIQPTVKTGDNGNYQVSVTVKNTGSVAGKEVVQAYVSAPSTAELQMPAQELKAFAKTHILNPGESQTLNFTIAASDLQSYDEQKKAWVKPAGDYRFLLGTSSRNTIEASQQ